MSYPSPPQSPCASPRGPRPISLSETPLLRKPNLSISLSSIRREDGYEKEEKNNVELPPESPGFVIAKDKEGYRRVVVSDLIIITAKDSELALLHDKLRGFLRDKDASVSDLTNLYGLMGFTINRSGVVVEVVSVNSQGIQKFTINFMMLILNNKLNEKKFLLVGTSCSPILDKESIVYSCRGMNYEEGKKNKDGMYYDMRVYNSEDISVWLDQTRGVVKGSIISGSSVRNDEISTLFKELSQSLRDIKHLDMESSSFFEIGQTLNIKILGTIKAVIDNGVNKSDDSFDRCYSELVKCLYYDIIKNSEGVIKGGPTESELYNKALMVYKDVIKKSNGRPFKVLLLNRKLTMFITKTLMPMTWRNLGLAETGLGGTDGTFTYIIPDQFNRELLNLNQNIFQKFSEHMISILKDHGSQNDVLMIESIKPITDKPIIQNPMDFTKILKDQEMLVGKIQEMEIAINRQAQNLTMYSDKISKIRELAKRQDLQFLNFIL